MLRLAGAVRLAAKKGTRMSKAAVASLAAAFALLLPAVAQAQTSAPVLQPIGDWAVAQESEYCELSRRFDSESRTTTLFIYSYGPTGPYRITLEGEDLPRNTNRAQVGSVGFGSAESLSPVDMIIGRRENAGTLNFLSHRDDAGFRFGYIWSGQSDAAYSVAFDPAATELSFDTGEMEPRTLLLGSMTAALESLRACEAALFASWNLAVEPAATIATPARIENGWDVVVAMHRPPAMLINRASQMVQVRLVIDADGTIGDCVLQAPNWRDRDQRDLCRSFTRIGQFTPARNTAGEAVPSLLRGSFLMLIFD